MAQQSQADRKSQLIADLERSRTELGRSLSGVRQDLDVGSHLKHAFARQKTAWLAGAVIAGWILSRIPARKKSAPKSSVKTSPRTELKETERAGIWLALLSLLGTLIKPAVTAFVSRKIAQYVENNQDDSSPPRNARR